MKNKLLQITLILSILVLGLTCKKPVPETTGNVQGTVKNSNGQIIDGASVKINTSPEQTKTTATDGFYKFESLLPQKYQITVSKTGFEQTSQNVDIVAGEPKTLDFVLNVYNPTFTITAPSSGITWQTNSQQSITWTSTGLTGNVKIELIKGTSFLKTIETSTENDGSYQWILPNDLQAATDYKIKITSLTVSSIFDESDYFSISTVAPTLTVSPSNQTVTMSAGTTNFTITSTTNWTATSSATSWCTVTQNGTGNGTLTATVTENTSGSQRVATITISAIGLTDKTVTVTQTYVAATLTVTPTNQNVAKPAGTTTFTVNSNTSWTATSNSTSWCTVTANGTGNGTITATYTENITNAERIATITIAANGVSNKTVTVTQSFSSSTTVTDYDGNVYNTVTIGTQTWMKENLKTTHYRNGILISDGTGIGNYSGQNTPNYYFNYNDNISNVTIYGRLYTWFAATDVNSICPNGWHLPSNDEFKVLSDYLGGDNVSGGKMKTTGTIQLGSGLWSDPNTGATNSSEFSVLPSGDRDESGVFVNLADAGYFWSSTQNDISGSWRCNFWCSSAICYRVVSPKKTGFSVRCIKDTK